jgi:creatinine amidohydrolase
VTRDSTRTIPAPPVEVDLPLALAELTTEELARALGSDGAVALLPIGSTEPHGPHLPLATDALLSEEACRRAAAALREKGRPALVVPSIGYGVTRYARDFRGAVGISAATLTALIVDVTRALLDDGFAHVVLVNNHLEPEHVHAIEAALGVVSGERGPECVSFPNQLGKRWGRTLTDEFKRGDCHAGRYETSLVLATRPELVRGDLARELPVVTVSLSREIKLAGGRDVRFAAIGMHRAYTGAPAEATRAEGEDTYDKLVTMIVTEVEEHLEEGEGTQPGEIPKSERTGVKS